MSDKLTWFKFSPSDWMMGRIRKLPKEVQADFIALMCVYWNNLCCLTVEDAQLEVGEKTFEQLVKYKIVKINEDWIEIHFLDIQLKLIDQDAKSKSESGRMGNLKRWHSDLFQQVKDGKLSLKKAEYLAKQSYPDRTPIAEQSQNIAEKKRKEENREEKRESNRFTAPTISEIQQYAKEKKYVSFNAARFHAYYESNGWKVGKNKMKDWKAAARGWQSRESENTQVQTTASKYDFL